MAAVTNLNAVLGTFKYAANRSSKSAINIIILLATFGTEQFFSFAVFSCPCLEANDTKYIMGQERLFRFSGNAIYGGVFITVPAFTLFFVGYSVNTRMWKMMTGCCNRDSSVARACISRCFTFSEITVQSLVAPCAWISIALLDGKYYACATTIIPYDMACTEVMKLSAGKIQHTVEYEKQRHVSQVIGWLFVSVVLLVGALVYMCYWWCSPLTYYQDYYQSWYADIEREQFEEIAKRKITEETKHNINCFFDQMREKVHWDSISTVFTHKENEGVSYWSQLHLWHDKENHESCTKNI